MRRFKLMRGGFFPAGWCHRRTAIDRSARLIALLLLAGICATSASTASAAAAYSATLSVDTAHPLGAANPLVLGSNVQWVDRGDELLRRDGMGFSQPMLEQVKLLGVTLLRYPGGSLSDLYHWRDGLGDLSLRGQDEHFFSGRSQRVEFGTQEFLELCEVTGAQPLITVNTATGSPEEAAAWVRRVNVEGLISRVTGKSLPKVHFWEIGNEPYLKDDKQKKLWITPDAFAAKASAIIDAMRSVDPTIEVGIPLRSDTIGGRPATPIPGFNEAVLSAVKPRIDFVALHDAYLPHATDENYSQDDLYLATMAAPLVVEADFAATRQMLTRLRPGAPIKLAVTEYSAIYSYKPPTDAYINTPAAALYVGLLLRTFSYSPDVQFANLWSLSGNWFFGSINQEAKPRAAFTMLRAYRDVLRGNLVNVSLDGPTLDSPRVGYVPAMHGVPKVRALATLESGTLRVLIINCDPGQAASIAMTFTNNQRWAHGTLRTFQSTSRFDSAEGADRFHIEQSPINTTDGVPRVEVPAVGFAVLELFPQTAERRVNGR